MGLIGSVLSAFSKKRLAQIESFKEQPFSTQTEEFEYLIGMGKSTEFGKRFGIESNMSYKDYSSRVPVLDYEGHKPFIDRMMAGEQNILWPDDIRWYAKSSGTTSAKSKFIPVSKHALEDCHFRAAKDLIITYLRNYPESNYLSGKGLVMGGSTQINQIDGSGNSQYGDVSAVMMKNMPLVGHFIKTPDLSVAMMEDFEKKLEIMAQTTIKKNVTHMAGVPTWTLVLLKRILEETGKSNILEIWPNLEVYFHGGVSFTPYRKQFQELIPTEYMHYMETYNASEGFFGIQDDPSSDELLLMLDYGIFYEFMPVSEFGKEFPSLIPLEDVQLGKVYGVVISTNGGLWRYQLGDTIKFTSSTPYKFKISGRTKHFINVFGEEVMIDNSDQAIAIVSSALNCGIRDYTVGPRFLTNQDKGGHEWVIEFDKEPECLQEFTHLLDQSLQELNSDYEAKRYKDMALTLPIVNSVPRDTFYSWMKSRGKLGGQNKVPRLSNSREYVESILNFVELA